MDLKGLSHSQVIENRQKYGENKLPEKKLKSAWDFFIETFQDKMNQILLALLIVFVVLAALGQASISEPVGIGAVLLAIALINTKTGLKSQKSTKELKDRTSIHFCNVIRDGEVKHINTTEIVVGDIVLLQSGEGIYADGYLIDGKIKVNNAVLNGESVDVKKTPIVDYVYDRNKKITGDDYVDQNSLFSGTTITEGEGKMIVGKVGVETVNGQTIMSMEEIEETKTSLQIQLDDLADQISKFGYVGAVIIIFILLATRWLNGGSFTLFAIVSIVVTAITVIVAAVPEGLPLIINLITGQNVKVMLKKNILAKNVNKIPEAGNIQLLCTDKTGTLTKGMLVPVHVVDVMGTELDKTGTTYETFKQNIILNSSAMFDDAGEIIGGNATERALLSLVNKNEFEEISKINIVDKLPFNSANKYSAAQVEFEDGHKYTFYKGAPEKLLKAANYNSGDKVYKVIKQFTSQAMRVIATAYSENPIGEGLPDDLIITSLVAIRDDVREEVPEAVTKMHGAGVQVMMITGDVIDTAKAIAKDSGLITSNDDISISAIDLDQWSDEEVKNNLSKIKVIARATPDTKLRIVRLAQELNLCVGMTGDGTNDSPALKQADVGFSMGSGTDVCKEAGDIIIIDDNFVSITNAVLLGRTFMHNVMKFLKFQLPINIGLVLLSVLFPVIKGCEAIAAVQILLINIVMDGLNSLSFGGEPAKDEYMLEKPIPKGSKLLSKETVSQIAVSVIGFMAIYGITLMPWFQEMFATEELYLTARFALLVLMATLNGFNIRTDHFNLFEGISKNKLFIEVAIAIFVGAYLIVTFGGSYLHCVPLNGMQWAVLLGLAFLIVPIDLIRKLVLKLGGK